MLRLGRGDVLGWPGNMALMAGKPFNLQFEKDLLLISKASAFNTS